MLDAVSSRVIKTLVIAIFTLAVSTVAYASPTPIVWPTGNPSCATLNASSDPAVAFITSDWEFKVDPPTEGPVTLTGGGLVGGMPATPNINLSMQYTISGGERIVMTAWSLGWTGTLNRTVTAVIVKGGNGGANVYLYPGGDTGDIGTFVLPTGQGISHLSFCFGESTAPSAADGSIAGRVVDYSGRGVSSAVLTLLDLNTGETRQVISNTFGYYKFTEVETLNVFNLEVKHRRYTFTDAVRTFGLNGDSVSEMNFSAAR